ncbi:hypothetical protein ACFQVA_26245 [Actinomadura keratinilytica]
MHRRRRTSLALMAATLLAAPLLSACGADARPGAAAVVGGERITVAQLEAQVGQVRDAQVAVLGEEGTRTPSTSSAPPPARPSSSSATRPPRRARRSSRAARPAPPTAPPSPG